MGRFIKYGWTLFLLYFAGIGLAFYLNWGKKETLNKPGLIISGIMFAIVFAVFCFVNATSFFKLGFMRDTLEEAANKLPDQKDKDGYRWDSGKREEIKLLITEGPLREEYNRFFSELTRLNDNGTGYSCNIENYINEDIIDQKSNRSLLNLVPGAMTGMGILGTFIGLALGLQGFNLGNSTEIIKSITPLMGGLKVAFHTSIYGMIYSLVFNLISRYKISKTYEAADKFIVKFSNTVLPDSMNENQNRMLKEQQTLNTVMETSMNSMQKALHSMVDEQKELNENLNGYSKKSSEAQMKAMRDMAREFSKHMGKSLVGDLDKMHAAIQQTSEMQKQNSVDMKHFLLEFATMTEQIQDVNRKSVDSVKQMSQYISDMSILQRSMNSYIKELNKQLEETKRQNKAMASYISDLVQSENRIAVTLEENTGNTAQVLEGLNNIQAQLIDQAELQYQGFVENAIQQNEIITSAAEKQLERMSEYTNQYTASMSSKFDELVSQTILQNQMLSQQAEEQIKLISWTSERSHSDRKGFFSRLLGN